MWDRRSALFKLSQRDRAQVRCRSNLRKGAFCRDILVLVVAHYASPHTKIRTVPVTRKGSLDDPHRRGRMVGTYRQRLVPSPAIFKTSPAPCSIID